ncbi:hypothetical protein [Roseateles paludis]|uniref:Uncharacterized protein n=1 Tax=Roseateles paludis TaxID=3145238 RepID=A0ABV0FVE9_9BURK
MNPLLRYAWLLCVPSLAIAAAPELALNEHVRLTAKTSQGTIAVVSGAGLDRAYQWNDCSLSADMHPRASRWFGSLGIYDPAPSTLRLPLNRCNGVYRTVVQEGQIHFADPSAANAWLLRYSKVRPTIWSNDGLVVQWAASLPREQLSVDVWQVCIANQYPKQLPGADDAALQLARIKGNGPARRPCASVDAGVVLATQAAWQQHWESVDPSRVGR